MLPIPEDIIRVQLTHKMNDGPEVVSNTLHLRLNKDIGTPTDWPAHVQEIATKVRDKYISNGCLQQLHQSTIFMKATAYHLSAATGKTIDKADSLVGAQGQGQAGGQGTKALPFDVACAVSLRTDVAGEFLADPDTGASPAKRSRGRIFVGTLSTDAMNANTGRFSPVFTQALADVWTAFLNDVMGMTVGGGASPSTTDCIVLSRAAGTARKITKVVVNDLPDTQQRRSNRLLPSAPSVGVVNP